ncbi:hypothetical protein [Sorangium sp. So ce145]|uniref:hypothetical protein n=1 Tax=Sorangium sp. So ce145 TaxID=3133285 RepID=UPI003F5EA44B
MRMRKYWLIALLAVTLSGDTMLTVALVWTALASSKSTLPLGLTLALMSVAPYALQSAFPQLKSWISRAPLHAFAAARGAGLLVAVGALLLPSPMPLWTLYGVAGAFTITVFIVQQCIETTMASLVLRDVLSAGEASRMSQTSIQLGAFTGGALGGMLLERAGIRFTFIALIGTLAVGSLIPALLRDEVGGVQRGRQLPSRDPGPQVRPARPSRSSSRSLLLWLALLGVLVLTIQLGSYNYLFPIVMQKGKLWHASDYGLVSASAGVGALLASLIVVAQRAERWQVLASVFVIALADTGLWITRSVVVAMALTFVLGYAFNTLRIRQRTLIFENVASDREGAEWAARTTVVFQVTKAALPILLALVIDASGVTRAGPGLAIVGCAVAAVLLFITTQQGRHASLVAIARSTAPSSGACQ